MNDTTDTTGAADESVTTVRSEPVKTWRDEIEAVQASIAPLCLDDMSSLSAVAKALNRVCEVLLRGSGE